GLVLLGDGAGNFSAVSPASSGFHVGGDGKALASLVTADGALLFIATQNRDSLRVFQSVQQENARWFTPQPTDVRVILEEQNGTKRTMELYHGSGYLSQSTRKVRIPSGMAKVSVVDSRGNERQLGEDMATTSK
ncbi:MAG: hypothetical protein LOY03_02275, partial [Cyclobacteriaceae bacterium]|nr:hypothetical protein [Cyclobacteriaceae bacterium]